MVAELTAEYVRRALDYNPETGLFVWRTRPLSDFPNEASGKTFNSQFAGKPAGSIARQTGYPKIHLGGKLYLSHRLAWLHVHGEWPEHELDHVSGDRTDNRLINLRVATRTENSRNACIKKNNKSGVTGVHFDKSRQKWMAFIDAHGRYALGRFHHFEAAVEVRKFAEKYIGYHPNHGRPPVTHEAT